MALSHKGPFHYSQFFLKGEQTKPSMDQRLLHGVLDEMRHAMSFSTLWEVAA
jgi:hypothetical protein